MYGLDSYIWCNNVHHLYKAVWAGAMLPDFFLQLILPNHCNCLISGSRPGFLEFLWLGQAGYHIYFTLSLKLSQILTLHFFPQRDSLSYVGNCCTIWIRFCAMKLAAFWSVCLHFVEMYWTVYFIAIMPIVFWIQLFTAVTFTSNVKYLTVVPWLNVSVQGWVIKGKVPLGEL